jgi:hypothetical protein
MAVPTVEQLTADARYHRERLDLYRAKAYALRPTTEMRMRELENAAADAEARLKRAIEAERKVAS